MNTFQLSLRPLFLGLLIACFGAPVVGQDNASSAPKDSSYYQVIDGIVAVVGDHIILQSEVESQVFQMLASGMMTKGQPVCPVVEQLMLQKLLLHQAELDSIEVSEADITANIDRRLAYYVQMLGSVEAFEAQYGQSVASWKAEFRLPVAEQMMAERMQGEIEGQVRSTPQDISNHFEGMHPDSLPLIPEEIRYAQIVIEPEVSEALKLDTHQFLDSVRGAVVAGNLSMTLAALRHSQDPGSKYKGGCYENIRRGQFNAELEAQVYATPEGAFSPVFESDYGLHFVKTTELRGEVFSMCHVLVKPTVSAEAVAAAGAQMDSIARWLAVDSLTWNEAVLLYSTDEETRLQEGRVINERSGGLYLGVDELPAGFFFVLNELEEGGHSAPALASGTDQQAYAIYKLEARKAAHPANPQQDFELFQQLVESTLKQDKLDRWVRKRLGETYARIADEFSACDWAYPWNSAAILGATNTTE
jgi:peptidyl-prolyl cis-trans isomerase SurA